MIRILAIGKVKDKRLAALADDFYKRLRPMAPAEVIELKDSQPEKEGRRSHRRPEDQLSISRPHRSNLFSSRRS